jgi:hypothetical protein
MGESSSPFSPEALAAEQARKDAGGPGKAITKEERDVAAAAEKKAGFVDVDDDDQADDGWIEDAWNLDEDDDDETVGTPEEDVAPEPSSGPQGMSMEVARALTALHEAGFSEGTLTGLEPERLIQMAQEFSGASEAPGGPAPSYQPSPEVTALRETFADEPLSDEAQEQLFTVLENMDRSYQMERMQRLHDIEAGALATVEQQYGPNSRLYNGQKGEILKGGRALWRAGLETGAYTDDAAGLAKALQDKAFQLIGKPRGPRPATVPRPGGGGKRATKHSREDPMSPEEFEAAALRAADRGDAEEMKRLRALRQSGGVGEGRNQLLTPTSYWGQ